MGCVSSKPDINDLHPNIFQVTNVNEQGDLVSPGKLEVTETELVLYQRNQSPIIWPLRALRKYGFDADIFSFECGRRCPTGQGIYAFRCRKAELLFNIVQQNIGINSATDDHLGANGGEFVLPTSSTGPPVQRRPQQSPEGYLNPAPQRPVSNGPLSPTGAATATPPLVEHNNNKRKSVSEVTYANLGLTGAPEAYLTVLESPDHMYMNIDTNKEIPEVEVEPYYANIDTKERKVLNRCASELQNVPPQTPIATTTAVAGSLCLTVHEVNYAELDLETANKKEASAPLAVPDSPKTKKSYATIDFQKTNALSQSINPPLEVEEGSRKTRHNSTIGDVTTTTVTSRHSSSLSD